MTRREEEHFERHAGYPPDDAPLDPDQDLDAACGVSPAQTGSAALVE